MADVFISYSRANQAVVAVLAAAVQRAGYTIWWDAELPPHRSYGDVITEQIAEAKATIVVWSETAAASEWVRAEADLARNQKKLIQASIDDKLPPMPFNQIQFATIGDWQGEDDHGGWRKIKASLAALCGEATGSATMPASAHPLEPRRPPVSAQPMDTNPAKRSSLVPIMGGVAVLAVGALGFVVWNGQRPEAVVKTSDPVTINVTAPVTGPIVADTTTPADPTRYDQPATTDDPDGFTNVRAGPSVKTAIVGRVTKGEAFTTARQSGGWWRVRTADGRTGWMSSRYIRLLSTNAELGAAPLAGDPVVSDRFDTAASISDPRPGFTNVRAGPSANSAIVAKVDRDEPFSTYPQDGAWWRVRTRDGSVGWMARSMIRMDRQASPQ